MERFSSMFWNQDFCSSAGFDELSLKAKHGRSVLKDLDKFLRMRTKAEEDYSKSLSNILKTKFAELETGTLKTAWERLVQETSSLAKLHLESSVAMMDAASRVKDYLSDIKSKQKKQEDLVRRSFTQKTNLYKRTQDSMKSYQNKCEDEHQLQQEIDAKKMAGEVQATKEWSKKLEKHSKLKEEVVTKESQYKENVCAVENSRKNWEADMVSFCDLIQKLEAERHNFVRNELWVHANIISQTCVYEDDACESMRQTFEKCNARLDLSNYVKTKSTGKVRPESAGSCEENIQ